MSFSAALHSHLAAVMESMVHAAVAELKKLVEGNSALLLSLEVRTGSSGSGDGDEPPIPAKQQADSREKMVRGDLGHRAVTVSRQLKAFLTTDPDIDLSSVLGAVCLHHGDSRERGSGKDREHHR